MLMLTRFEGETVVITPPAGPEIRVAVTQIGTKRVRLGFEAPTGVAIDREEIHQRKQREKRHG